MLPDDATRPVAPDVLVSAEPCQAELPVARIGQDECENAARLEGQPLVPQHGIAELSIRLVPAGNPENRSVDGHGDGAACASEQWAVSCNAPCVSSPGRYMEHTMIDHPRQKSATLNLRIEPEIKAALEKAAKAERRSVTSYIEMLLIPHLRAGGYLPADGAKGRKAR